VFNVNCMASDLVTSPGNNSRKKKETLNAVRRLKEENGEVKKRDLLTYILYGFRN